MNHKESPNPFRISLMACRANLIPGLILQALAIAIVLAYFYWSPITSALENAADLKAKWGYLFSIPSTALFGGVIPLYFLRFQKSQNKDRFRTHLPFYALFWAFKGFEVDTLYRVQVVIFGDNQKPITLLCKVLFDQFIYVTLWAAPTMVIGYLWKDSEYSFRSLRKNLGKQWYIKRVFPLLLANWFVWVPAVAMIYYVKPALQLPLQNLILCIWSLLVVFVTKHSE